MTDRTEHERLHDLLTDASSRAGLPSTALTHERTYQRLARRHSMLRTAVLAGVTILTVAALTPALLTRIHQANATAVAAGESSTATPTASATEPAPAAPVYDNSSSPAKAEIGVPYRFNLLTHCGVEYLRVDDRVWLAKTPLGDAAHNPPPGWPSPMALGTVELTASNALTFKLEGQPPVDFGVTGDALPLCI